MPDPYIVRAMWAASGPSVVLTGQDGRRWIVRDRQASAVASAYDLPVLGDVRITATVDPDGMLRLGEGARHA